MTQGGSSGGPHPGSDGEMDKGGDAEWTLRTGEYSPSDDCNGIKPEDAAVWGDAHWNSGGFGF